MQNWPYATKLPIKTTSIFRHDAMLHKRTHTGELRTSMTLLRSERPRGMRAKLHTVEACNKTDRRTISVYCCLFAPLTRVCYAWRTSQWWCIAHSTLRLRSGCTKANDICYAKTKETWKGSVWRIKPQHHPLTMHSLNASSARLSCKSSMSATVSVEFDIKWYIFLSSRSGGIFLQQNSYVHIVFF